MGEGTAVLNAVSFERTFLIVKHFQANIHKISDGYHGTSSGMDSKPFVAVALVAINLSGIAAEENFTFDDLCLQWT